MKRGYLIREEKDNGKQTLGHFIGLDNVVKIFECKTLELPWKNNERQVSCYPKGTYTVKYRTSEKYGEHYEVTGIPNRSLCLFHAANYSRQLLGCTAVGRTHTDIDNDGLIDVTSSKETMQEMVKAFGKEDWILTVL